MKRNYPKHVVYNKKKVYLHVIYYSKNRILDTCYILSPNSLLLAKVQNDSSFCKVCNPRPIVLISDSFIIDRQWLKLIATDNEVSVPFSPTLPGYPSPRHILAAKAGGHLFLHSLEGDRDLRPAGNGHYISGRAITCHKECSRPKLPHSI